MKENVAIVRYLLCVFIGIAVSMASSKAVTPSVRVGADNVERILQYSKGKKIGMVINHTSRLSNGVFLLDTLLAMDAEVLRIFTPEHGLRGDADAGETVLDGYDTKTGIPVVSLYGKNKRPTQKQLSGLDMLLFDIQDVGARFYTYISTLHYVMDACAEYDLEVLVTDRPNPNDTIDGPVLELPFRSFVGMHPIPILHGLTVGELARMINGQGWLTNQRQCALSVISVEGWKHGQPYDLQIKPSPNLPNAQSILLYPSLCFFEATQISVGRGTYMPFQVVGYPHVSFGEFDFVPQSLPGYDKHPLQKGNRCYGLDLRMEPASKGVKLTWLIHFYKKMRGIGKPFFTSPRMMDRLAGNGLLRKQIEQGVAEEDIRATWQPGLRKYKQMRKKYLLYKE